MRWAAAVLGFLLLCGPLALAVTSAGILPTLAFVAAFGAWLATCAELGQVVRDRLTDR